MQFFRQVSYSTLSVGVRAACSLLVNKVVALYFGSGGITLLAHFQNLVAVFTQLPHDGVNRGLIKYWAELNASEADRRRHFYSALAYHVFFLVLAAATLGIGGKGLLGPFAQTMPVYEFALWLLLGLLGLLAQLWAGALLLACQRVAPYALLQAAVGVLTAIFVCLAAWWYDMRMLLLLYMAAPMMVALLAIGYLWREKLLPTGPGKISKKALGQQGRFILMALSVVGTGRVLDFAVRQYMIAGHGLEAIGLWQGVVKVSDGLLMVFIGGLGAVYYPRVAALLATPEALKAFVRRVQALVMAGLAVGLGVLFGLRHHVLTVLLSPEFLQSAPMVGPQLLGDFFALSALLLAHLLAVQAKTRLYVAMQVLSAGVYLLALWAWEPVYGLTAIPWAHALRHVAFFAGVVALNRNVLFR